MNAKTAKQIAEMKNQTFGVEIEMNSITRAKAAKTAAEFFGNIGRGAFKAGSLAFAEKTRFIHHIASRCRLRRYAKQADKDKENNKNR